MLPLVHGTYVFPYESCPCHLVGKLQPNSQRGGKNVLFPLKIVLKTPNYHSIAIDEDTLYHSLANKQNPQGSNT